MKVTFDHKEIEALILGEAVRMGLKVNTVDLSASYSRSEAVLTWEAPEPPIQAAPLTPPNFSDDDPL